MVLVMDMSTGERLSPLTEAYGEEVLNAGWTPLPRVEPRLELVQARAIEPQADPGRFLAAFYAAQE